MFPLHPFAVKNCTFLDKTLMKSIPIHLQIEFPFEMKSAVIHYTQVIQPILRESTWVYNLNQGWINRLNLTPFQVKVE